MSLHLGRRLLAFLGAAALATGAPHPAAARTPSTRTPQAHRNAAVFRSLPAKQECVYSALRISILDQFDQMVGRDLNCAHVYANAAPDWTQWEKPWFINYLNEPNLDWSAWATAPNTTRQLVITLSLFPSNLNHTDWLTKGAAGDYSRYDTALAENLIAAGLGNAIISLAPEANGNWYPYSLGTTGAQWAKWDTFWSKSVEAMRAVPGAHFAFDWTVNVGYRPLPLSEIYPGNNVVDIIGMDVYDVGKLGNSGAARWNTTYNEADGVNAVLHFAHSENKPLSIPEWGIAPRTDLGSGDNATFVNGIASVVKDDPVVYESYFYKYDYATQLAAPGPALSAYRRHFGAHGDSVDTGTDRWSPRTVSRK